MSARYRLDRLIHRSSRSEVYEATAFGSGDFHRRVAIKRLMPEAVLENHASFIDEARITSELSHGNIISVLDFGLMDERPFLVMERLLGRDLEAWLARAEQAQRPIPAGVAYYLCAQIGRGLEHAHRARDAKGRALGIVHRDVSPDNILVSNDGDVKLTDFGIAYARDRKAETQVGVVKGKLDYLSPEQLRGTEVSPATDVFGLGCVLYRLLVGQSPLIGMSPALIASGAEISTAAVSGVAQDILRRALASEAGGRFESAGRMSDALDEAAIAERPPGTHRQLMRWLEPLTEGAPPSLGSAGLVGVEPIEGERRYRTVVLSLNAHANDEDATVEDVQPATEELEEGSTDERPLPVAPTEEMRLPPARTASPPQRGLGALLVAALIIAVSAAAVVLYGVLEK